MTVLRCLDLWQVSAAETHIFATAKWWEMKAFPFGMAYFLGAICYRGHSMGPNFGVLDQIQYKSMVIFRDFPYNGSNPPPKKK